MADTYQKIYQVVIDASKAKTGGAELVAAINQIVQAGTQTQTATASLSRLNDQVDAIARRVTPGLSASQQMAAALAKIGQAAQANGQPLEQYAGLIDNVILKYDAAAKAAKMAADAQAQYASQARTEANQSAFSSFMGVKPEITSGSLAGQNSGLIALNAQMEEQEKTMAALGVAAQSWIAKYDPLTAAQTRYATAVEQGNKLLDQGLINAEQYTAGLKMEEAVLDSVTAAQKRQSAGGGAFRSIGGLELQASAINFVQGIAGGISPLRMLEVEGPQVFGAFVQDAKGATTALTSMWQTLLKFAPLAGILGGLATVRITLGSAFFKGQAEVEAFNKAVILSGNAAGVTRGSFEGLVSSIEKASNLGPATIRAIATEMVGTGKIAAPVIEQLTELSANYAKATGQDAEKAGSSLAKLFSDPKQAMQQLDDQYNLLDAAQKRHIQDLILQGDRTQAQIELSSALSQRLQGLSNDGLGWLQRAWRGVEGAANDAWDAMKGIGRGQTLEEQLTAAQSAASRAANPYGGRFGGAAGTGAQAQADVTRLQTAISGQNDLATLDAQAAKLREGGKAAAELADQYGGAQKQSRDLNDQLIGMQSHLADVNAQIAKMGGSEGAGPQGVIGHLAEDAKNTAQAIGGLQNQLHILARTPVMEAQDRLKIEQQVNAASPTQRAALRARLTAQYNASYSSDQTVANNPAAIKALGDAAATQAIGAETTAVRDQNTQLDLNAKLTLATGEAWMKSATDGALAAARQQASVEALTQPINVNSRQLQILNQQVNDAVTAGAQQVRSLDDQVAAQQRLAAAAKDGPLAEHQAEVTNQITDATKSLNEQLQLAFATKNVRAAADLQAEIGAIAKNMQAADDAAQSAARSLQLVTEVQDQGYQMRLLQVQLANVGANDNQQQKALAIAQAQIDLEKQHQDLSSQGAQDYVRNAAAIADMNAELTRQKAIASELPNAFDQAFDRIGQAVTQFAVQGGDAFKSLQNIGNAVLSELLQEGLKLALINPLKNWAEGNNALPVLNDFLGGGGSSSSTVGVRNQSTGSFDMSSGGGGLFSWLGSLFEDGGIMTSRGPIKLNTYASGGIANSPQMAVFGEGRMAEAYVPLPDGNRIPVELRNFQPAQPANSNGGMVVQQHLHFHTKEAVDQFRRSPGQTMNAAYRSLQAAGARN